MTNLSDPTLKGITEGMQQGYSDSVQPKGAQQLRTRVSISSTRVASSADSYDCFTEELPESFRTSDVGSVGKQVISVLCGGCRCQRWLGIKPHRKGVGGSIWAVWKCGGHRPHPTLCNLAARLPFHGNGVHLYIGRVVSSSSVQR